MLEPPAGLEGTVELIVEAEGDAPERQFLVTSRAAAPRSRRSAAPSPTATVRGTVAAWVRALGPEGSAESLEITGRDGLAGAVLDGFTRARARRAAAAA